MNKQKEEAYMALDAVHYKGEKTTFTFEHFTNIPTKAYNGFQHFGEPVLESKKVQDLLNKISDPKLEGTKQTVKITPGYKDNFAAAINFIAKSAMPLSKISRLIYEVAQQEEPKNFARGTRYQERGRGCFHHGGGRNAGRGERGRGRGRSGARGGRGIGGCHVPYITPQTWATMSYEEQ